MLPDHDTEAHARALELSRAIDDVDNAHRPNQCPMCGGVMRGRDVLECERCGERMFDDLPRLESN